MNNGYAQPPEQPGLGIEWDWKAIERMRNAAPIVLTAAAVSKPAKPVSKPARKR
jgi:hypothetical protein